MAKKKKVNNLKKLEEKIKYKRYGDFERDYIVKYNDIKEAIEELKQSRRDRIEKSCSIRKTCACCELRGYAEQCDVYIERRANLDFIGE